MRGLKRNMTPFWYCLYQSSSYIEDEYDNTTGELDVRYAEAVQMYANVSAATGQAQTEMFGGLDGYDKVIVTADMGCPIDENTVLFIDKEPEYPVIPPTPSVSAVSEPDGESEDDPEPEPVPQYDTEHPKYDYIVKRVAKSLNSISIAVRKVEIGG